MRGENEITLVAKVARVASFWNTKREKMSETGSIQYKKAKYFGQKT